MKTSDGASSKPSLKNRSGLSLVELLVILALVAIFFYWIIPAPRAPKVRAKAVACMNNTKQLTVAWLTYAADNHDQLMPNPGWAAGVMDWNPDNPDNTNSTQLIDREKSLIGDYMLYPEVFKCPADDFTSRKFKSRRVRSYSLNSMLAGTNGPTGTARMTTDLNIPGPGMIPTFLCEHPDSINDGTFEFDPASSRWRDLPSGNHPGPNCGMGFTDGHAELHKWLETLGANKTVYPVTMITNRPWASRPVATSRDYQWMQERMPHR